MESTANYILGLHISFSPSACVAAMLDSEGQMQLRLMEHSYGAENGAFEEDKFSAAIAALTLAFCRGFGSDINTDDILIVVIRQLSPGQYYIHYPLFTVSSFLIMLQMPRIRF